MAKKRRGYARVQFIALAETRSDGYIAEIVLPKCVGVVMVVGDKRYILDEQAGSAALTVEGGRSLLLKLLRPNNIRLEAE